MPKDPLQLVDLTTARTDFEAEVIAHALEEQGIPARAFSSAGSALQWEVAASQPIRVQVRRCDLQRAAITLARVRQESVDFDWSELDAEDFDTLCPKCGYSLKDLRDKSFCPECGRKMGPHDPPLTPRETKARRITWKVVVVLLLILLLLPIAVELLRSALHL